MDFKSKPFVPRQQQQHVPPQSYNVLAPTFVPNSSLSSPSPSPLSSSQEIEILCDIFSDMDVNFLKSTLGNKGNDLQATILSLTEMLDQSSSVMLDGIWKDHLEEYDDNDNNDDNTEEENNSEEEESDNNKGDKKNIHNTAAAAGFQPVFMYSSSPSPLSSKPSATPNTKNNTNINNTNSFKKQQSSTSLAKSKEEPVVCKYFLAGQCYRKDCMYLHTSTVCRYWKLGSCSRGDSCIYLHSEEEEKPQKNTKTTQNTNNSNNVKNSSTPKPAPPPRQEKEEEINNINNKINKPAPAYLKADMAANIKLKQLQTLFHHVEPGNVKSIFYNCNFQIEASTEQISKLYGKPRVVEAPVAPAKPAVYTTAPRKPKQWVETGEEVSRLYTECREEAIKHATARNTCFQFATMRYLAGDGLAAREWSKKGRYHDEMMRKLHNEACMKILTTRNQALASEMILDLHGLHKREAIEVLQQKIAMFKKSNAARNSGEAPVRVFYVIIGTGHHSGLGKSLIGRAVKEYMDQEAIRYTDCSDDNRGGMLTVYIK